MFKLPNLPLVQVIEQDAFRLIPSKYCTRSIVGEANDAYENRQAANYLQMIVQMNVANIPEKFVANDYREMT